MNRFRIAITKGRLLEDSIKLFEKIGYNCDAVKNPGRRLLCPVDDGGFDVVLAKAPDVITYIENGVCDMGIVGLDTILERGGEFYEVLDLQYGKCRFALAAKGGEDFYGTYKTRTVATKYPKVAGDFFAGKAIDVKLIKIEGSVELAPILGLADAIVDIVETGSTLKANGLEVLETVCGVSARLIVNTASMKLYRNEIMSLVAKCESALPL